ncbi:hypothetical protein SODALDRAFT_334915 [Sodiomyces alkalinus F11]|uniref:Uncharacterized protein n=1 Tax=Sodiomyces alkalinus (strain CBS 110278 / VKM F-3762 / F11) TaxID=1314773 RepID=A0A3N2PQG1_SODAK|nr:hypothetical protein SODALDRAFT_334915 [Sodiomyces alkalinus F11]ROT36718.1 hypothetical protein SODALDRAFT_334915 [Sodiomyces alkalinus F11]
MIPRSTADLGTLGDTLSSNATNGPISRSSTPPIILHPVHHSANAIIHSGPQRMVCGFSEVETLKPALPIVHTSLNDPSPSYFYSTLVKYISQHFDPPSCQITVRTHQHPSFSRYYETVRIESLHSPKKSAAEDFLVNQNHHPQMGDPAPDSSQRVKPSPQGPSQESQRHRCRRIIRRETERGWKTKRRW